MNKMRLRRAVLLGLAMSLTVGTVGFAEDIDHSLIVTDTDIIYPADGGPTNEDYTITADEGYSAIEATVNGKEVSIMTEGGIAMNTGNADMSFDGAEWGILADNGGVVNLQAGEKGIQIETVSDGNYYGNKGGLENQGSKVSLISDGNIAITGKSLMPENAEGNGAMQGIHLMEETAVTAIQAKGDVDISVEGSSSLGINVENGHLSVEARNITINSTNNSIASNTFNADAYGLNIYDFSEQENPAQATLHADENLTLNVVNNNQDANKKDASIAYGVAIVGTNTKNGVRANLEGKNVQIYVTNNGAIEGVGIGTQDSSASQVKIEAKENVTIDVQSTDAVSAGISTLSGKVEIVAGGNTDISAVATGTGAEGYAIYAGGNSQHVPDVKTDIVNITSIGNNTLLGTNIGIYATNNSSEVTIISKNGNNTLFAGTNIGSGFYDGNAIHAVKGATVTVKAFEESETSNIVHGSILAKDTNTTVTLKNNSNAIYSANIVKDESDVDGVRTDHITSAAYTKDGGMISITGNMMGNEYQNIIATSADTSQDNDENVMKERVVWAENGTISINGLTAIYASNGSIDDTNSVGIALVAGASRVEGNPEEETKPFSGVINANLADGSYIYGDMLAGNGGLLNIYKGAGSEITTFSNEGQAIQNATIQGNALSGNGGELNLKLGANTFWMGRADDYQDANSNTWKNGHTDIFTPEFSNNVESSGNVNIELDGAEWHVTGQSWVTNLSGNSGTVDLTNGTSTHALHVGNLTGSHNFVVNLDKEHSLSDMLYIHDVGTGEGDTNTYVQHVIINNIEGIDQIADGEKLRFATVLPGIDNLYFTGEYDGETIANDGIAARANMIMMRDRGVMNNAFLIKNEAYNQEDSENQGYNGDNFNEVKPGDAYIDANYGDNGTNWYLQRTKSADQTSDAGKTVVAMSRVNYANAVYMDRLNKRMGEARYIDGDEGLWVRIRHDRIGKSDAFRSKNTMMELGYDKRVDDREDGEHRRGFAIDYMRGTTDYHNVAGDGDVRRGGLWLYDTWLGDKGHYSDYVLKIGRLSNDFEVYARSTGEKITGDYSNFVYSASAEYGRKKDIGKDWYFEPQVQLQYAHVTDADYTTSQGTSVELDAIDSLIGRIGFRLGKDMGENNTFYVKADVLHEFLGDQDISAFDDTGRLDTTYENEGTWYDVGLGFSHQFSKGTYMFLDVEKTFGNNNEDTYQFNVGMNWKV